MTICLIGSQTASSRWVNWEVRESNDFGKGILGVRLYSNRQHTVPRAVLDSAAEVLDWNIDEIVAGIERAARRTGH